MVQQYLPNNVKTHPGIILQGVWMAPEPPLHLVHFRCIRRSPGGILAARILARKRTKFSRSKKAARCSRDFIKQKIWSSCSETMLNFWKKIRGVMLRFLTWDYRENIDFHVPLRGKLLNYQLSGYSMKFNLCESPTLTFYWCCGVPGLGGQEAGIKWLLQLWLS